MLEKAGSRKRYRNLLGVTLGTGFGGGIVRNGDLFLGDNSGAAEIWLLRNKLDPALNAEEGASIRAVQRAYAKSAGLPAQGAPSPKEIFEIAMSRKEGNKVAAREAYRRLGRSGGRRVGECSHAHRRTCCGRRGSFRCSCSFLSGHYRRNEWRFCLPRRETGAAPRSTGVQSGGSAGSRHVPER